VELGQIVCTLVRTESRPGIRLNTVHPSRPTYVIASSELVHGVYVLSPRVVAR